jgi:ubiquinone/menaquinone biosynthesis C-methylase UbiE
MLPHVADLDVAFGEIARVLKPGGIMLIYCTLATELLEPGEGARGFAALPVFLSSMHGANLEAAWRGAGLRVVHSETIAGEWREFWEENGSHTTARQLLKISRMRRDRERLIAELGQTSHRPPAKPVA